MFGLNLFILAQRDFRKERELWVFLFQIENTSQHFLQNPI